MASSATPNPHSYDVFLSFRGEDTRKNFTDHLYNALVAYGIHTFRDDEELLKGEDIKSGLSRAIEGSKIFIIIFSENYATSKWCLNELAMIIEYTTLEDNKVIPVFYHVKPSDVGHQSESFEVAFFNHEKDADQEKKELIEKWRITLKKAAKLSGYHVDNQHEAEVIQKIREVIITRLNRKPLYVGDHIVGMDFHLKQLNSLVKTELDDVHMVGIYGIGGIGKTTIAMAFYNDISSRFDGSSFLRGVGEKSKGGLHELQKKLLKDILKCQSPDFDDTSEGINEIKKRLCSKRVLIVLDDVEELEQLENLAGKNGWYGAKSTIIITTKDTSLLSQHGVNILYEVKELNHKEAIDLFNWWAFKQNIPKPKEDFESLSHCVVGYAKGLPIALKVLGGFLFGKKIDEWKSALHKLEKIPHMKVQSVLKVSYERLDDTERGIFLDIACFFKGKDKDLVSRILGGYADIGIKVLHERCLITISQNKLDMHDLLQQMGQEIVRQECLKEPGERSRLWDYNDVDSMLTRNTGTGAIQGLFVKIPTSNRMQFSTNSFTKMNGLRLFIVHNQWYWDCFKVDFEFPSSQLRYLKFYGCSLESLPTNFNGRNLVELDLVCSRIEKLWKGDEIFDNLKVINLSYSRYLVEIPDFPKMPILEILNLEGCTSLKILPGNFDKLEHLRCLSCKGCTSLKSFPKIKGNMSKLREINLSGTAIIEVPSSIEHLNGLEYFHLSGCFNLISLPRSICNLSSLQTLYLDSCSKLKGFPEMKDNMGNLERLNLSSTAIEELSSSVGHLKALKHLDLSECTYLVNLPESIFNISSLETLNVRRCLKLKDFPKIKNNMENLERLDLSYTAIEELPYSIGLLKALKHLDLSCCNNLVNLPESICNLSSLEKLVLKCPKLQRLEVNLEEASLLLRSLYPACCIIKQGVIWRNDRFSSLETLHLRCSQMEGEILNHHIWSLSSLVELCIRNSDLTGREILSDSFYPPSLVGLSVGNFNLMEVGDKGESNDSPLSVGIQGILNDIWNLSSLVKLSLYNCNLMEVGILSDIWNLSSLVKLSLNHCNLKEGEILNRICHLPSLEELSLNGNHFSSIPAGIRLLSNLRALNLRHCKKLQEIPELPSSLRELCLSHCKKLRAIPELPSNLLLLDMHSSDGISSLSNHSLHNCLKSKLYQEPQISLGASELRDMAMEIVIPRSSGILEGRRNQSMGSHQVRIELPQNWYENNDLLGFALCCVYVWVLDEFNPRYGPLSCLDCKLAISGNCQSKDVGKFQIESECYCSDDDDDHGSASDLVWVIYYPKDAIKKQYLSNQWTHFTASFESATLEAKECGIHPIYGCFKCRRDKECQQKLCLKGSAINELPFIESPFELGSLCLRECKNLESLPSTICELKSLTTLSCSGCSQLTIFPEILETLENLRELHLEGTAIEELPSSIQHLRGLQYLNLAYCNNLVSLPETIYRLKSLVFLSCTGCSQLKSFPEILENIENLRELSLDGTAIKELPTSIERLGGLQDLRLSNCSNLVNLPESICNLRFLKNLNVNLCSKLEKFPQNLGSLQRLELLGAAGSDSNQVLGAIQSDDCRMSSWKALNLSINYFSSTIPISIIQLSKLRVLDLSHCQKLLQIPELPPSLRILDVHACPCLETLSSPSSLLGFSLFRCFKSAIEEFECGSYWRKGIQIVIPGNNGIPEWISQQKKGSEITIELPMDWYHNNDFLGVALYSVYVPLHIESNEDPCSLTCQLNFHVHQFEFLDDLPSKFWSMNGLSYEFWPVDELWFRRGYLCHHNGDELNEVWVAYYPKVAIPNQYWSNKWRHLKASFHGYLGSKQVKVKECGFHLISMPKIVNRTIPQDRSIKGVEHNRPPILIQYPDVQRCCDTKSVPEDTIVNAQSCCDTKSVPEDTNVNAQSCCDDTHSTEHNHSPMDTITHNVDDNVVDAQDEEEDHMHKWLDLLCKSVQWICCRRC